ncbi:hypothetical protein G8759_14345 [Spirosoma aureum]|uniref:Sialate O-acetylesterase domain-containing protein n=1 Tax=Spirosoma aureum TaxID=2692134 RepID=A0A6G9AN16_9BACT|nr:putative Ig domain-containing protein [Spirosoma aureum]QIP13714.1 hypothetical protein G8759_14345 [Spirosoma aureum]
MPTTRSIFQRDNVNKAIISIAGNCPSNTTLLEARLRVRQGGQAQDWTTINAIVTGSSFVGSLSGSGGWYDLDVRALANGVQVGYWTVDRVGVGEVFITAGQSNNYGNENDALPAQDDRVNVVNYWIGGLGQFSESDLPKTFTQAGFGTHSGPAAPLFIWGGLGDRLVAQLNVPVLFLGASYPGSSSKNWAEAANGAEYVDGRPWNQNIPYRAVGASILHYVKRYGIRAVLWHQGESDNYYRGQTEEYQNYLTIINKSRSQSGMNIAWIVSRVSYISAQFGVEYTNHETDPAIIAAQNQIISSVSNVFPGPETDSFKADYRRDGMHFSIGSYPWLADYWMNYLNTSFFVSSTPSQPRTSALISTGYIFPFTVKGGQSVTVPFMTTAPTNLGSQFIVDALTENGQFVERLATSTNNSSIGVQIPNHYNGRYRLRVSQTSPAIMGEPSDVITVTSLEPIEIGGTLTLVAPVYNCASGAITFQTSGGNGSPIEYMAPGITGWTTNPNQYLDSEARTAGDTPPFTLYARQSGTAVTYIWSRQQTCSVNPPPPSAPLVTGSLPGLSGSRATSLAYSANVFQDPAGLALSYSYTGLPNGLNGAPNSLAITGTPLAAGTGSLTVTATNSANLSASTVGNWIISEPGSTGTLTLVAPVYNCASGAITFQTSGGNGSPIEYMAPGITGWTTNPNQYLDSEARTAGDTPPFTLYARQSGTAVTYIWSRQQTCSVNPPPPSAPLVTGSLPGLSGSRATSLAYSANVFQDPAGLALSYSYTGLPNGLNGAPNSLAITGTPLAAGTGSLTVTATNSANLSASTVGNWIISEPGSTGTLTLIAPVYNCASGAITFQTSGGNGSPIEYMAPGITGWTTNPAQFVDKESRTASDTPPFTLYARQNGVTVQYVWDLKASCGRSRMRAEEWVTPLIVTVLGNPVEEQLRVLIQGAEAQLLQLVLSNVTGEVIESRRIEQAQSEVIQTFTVNSTPSNVLILQAITETQQQSMRIIKK